MTNFQLVIRKFELISFAEIKKEQKKQKTSFFRSILCVLIIESHSEGKQK
jgi:hypothetical protein